MGLSMIGNRKAVIQRSIWRTTVRSTWILTLAGLLLAMASGPEQSAARAAAKMGNHVYCIRGLMNVFSLGMDEICDQLSKMGFKTSVHNHTSWNSIASDAAANYKSGQERDIVLIGHSLGAGAVADITARLGELGVPVRLAVELDSIVTTTVSGQVERFLNYYIENGAGKKAVKGAGFKGVLQNIDLSKMNVGHMSIDKDPKVQAKVIGNVRSALARRAAPKEGAASAGAISPTGPTTGSKAAAQ